MDRIFWQALIVSLCGHLLLLLPWANLRSQPTLKSFSEIEISYFEIKPEPPEEIKETRAVTTTKEDKEKMQEKVQVKESPGDEEKKEPLPEMRKAEKETPPALSKEEQMVARDFAVLSKEPAFLDYYRAIREKIKISANRHKPAFFNPGEVCVFFVLDNRGELRRLKIIDTRSSREPILRETSLTSVEDAAPFPPFPQGLKREQIAFNIIIAFEIK